MLVVTLQASDDSPIHFVFVCCVLTRRILMGCAADPLRSQPFVCPLVSVASYFFMLTCGCTFGWLMIMLQDMIRWGEDRRNKDPEYFAKLATAKATAPVWIISDARRPTDLVYFTKRFKTIAVRVEVWHSVPPPSPPSSPPPSYTLRSSFDLTATYLSTHFILTIIHLHLSTPATPMLST